MTRKTTVPILAFLLSAAVLLLAFADGARAGKKDHEFAKGLLKRKWFDMAEKVFTDLKTNGQTDEERTQGELGLIEVLKNRAEDESDPVKKKELFRDAIGRYKTFLEGSSDVNAQFNLAELLKTKGVEFSKLAQLEGTEEKEKKTLQDEAQKAFAEAVDLIKAFVNKMKDRSIDEMKPDQKDQLQRASFYHAELHFEMAKIFAGSADRKQEILKKAIELFEEFLWDWEEYVSAFHAYIKKGLCYLEMDQYELAISSYEAVLQIDTENAGEGMLRFAESLQKKAYYRIFEALNKAGKFDLTLERAAKMESRFSNIMGDDAINYGDGRMAIMEKAKAYAGKEQYSDAIAEVMPIVKMRGYYALLAVKLLSEWGSRDPTATVEVLFLQGEGLLQTGDFFKAVEAFEETIDKLSTKTELEAFGSKTWHQLGMAYAFLRRYYEAGLAFEEGERTWGEGRKLKPGEENWGSACAYRAYSAFKSQYTVSGTKFLKELYSEKRMLLTSKYPESKYAKNLQFFAAQDKMREGKFEEAVDLFQSVDKISEYFEDAQARIGRCWFGKYEALVKEHHNQLKEMDVKKYNKLKAQDKLPIPDEAKKYLDDAEKKLTGYIDLTKKTKVDGPEQRAKRHKSLAVTLFFLGRLYDEKDDAEKTLSFLDEFETKFKDMPEMILPASFIRLRAFFESRDPRGVEDMLRILVSTDQALRAKEKRKKVHIYLLIGYQLAGKLFGELSNKAKMDGQDELAEEYSSKAAEHLGNWIDNDPTIDRNRLDAVGIRLYKAGKFADAALVYEHIIKSFSDQLSEKELRGIRMKLGNCQIEMENWEQAKIIFEELNEKTNIVYIEKLVMIYNAYGDKFRGERKEKEANQLYDKAFELYGKLLKPQKPEKRQWWVWKLAVWEIMYKKGDYNDIVMQITKGKMMYPNLGGEAVKKKILALMEKAKEKAR